MKKLSHYYDIIIYLLHRTYWNIMSHFGNVHGIVLMYHYITDEHVDTLASCQHKQEVFESTLVRLKNEGYSFVSIDEMLELCDTKSTKKFAVITFDDIMDNVYSNAYPILKRMQLPFTLFVASGLIDKNDYVTSEHLMEMAKDPLCTVGSHTVSHCRLSKEINSKGELSESKKRLESLLGKEVKYLAYPYGWHCDVSRQNIKEAKESGYVCAFGTIQSPISEKSIKSCFFLPRIVLKG